MEGGRGKGGGGKGGGGKGDDDMVRISKRMSAVLRHNIEKCGLADCLRPDGYVPLARLLSISGFERVTEAMIEEVVRENSKQRFALIEEAGVKYIRANQGHSIVSGLDDEMMLELLDPHSAPTVIHGTTRDCWQKIMESGGLSRMGRRHIHFATGLPENDGVISGMRHSAQVHIYVDVVKAVAAGVVFYRSANGVILTAGEGGSGMLSLRFVAKVVDATTKRELPLAHMQRPPE
jgi:2'-phosphotransferase